MLMWQAFQKICIRVYFDEIACRQNANIYRQNAKLRYNSNKQTSVIVNCISFINEMCCMKIVLEMLMYRFNE